MIKIICLSEDYAGAAGVVAEFGLSLYIEFNGHKILFDTGQLGAFAKNAKKLAIDLGAVEVCIISHGHFDHCGGLAKFIQLNSAAPIYLRVAALQRKYKRILMGKFDIGIKRKLVASSEFTKRLIIMNEPLEIFSDCYLLGGFMPNCSEFEPLPTDLLNADKLPDEFTDEQVLIIRRNGLHIFAGCSHPGIIGMLEQIQTAFPTEKIVSVIAGMHMRDCAHERLNQTIGWFVDNSVDNVVPLHCTGFYECGRIKHTLGERCQLLHCGDELEIR